MRPIPLTFMVLAFLPLTACANSDPSSLNPQQETVQTETFHPPVVINSSLLLVNMTTIKNISGYPNVVMHVPCFEPGAQQGPAFPISVARNLAHAGKNTSDGFCRPQQLPGTTQLIDQTGMRITPH